MNETSTTITDALNTIGEGCDVLIHNHEHPYYAEVGLGVLGTAGQLIENYSCEYFSEAEVIFICDAMVCAIESLRSIITEDGNEELI